MFDVFGTVADWRTSVAGEFERVGARVGAQALAGTHHRVAPPVPADTAAGGAGEVPWRSLDELHRMILDEVLAEHGLTEFTDTDRTELVGAWHG